MNALLLALAGAAMVPVTPPPAPPPSEICTILSDRGPVEVHCRPHYIPEPPPARARDAFERRQLTRKWV